MINPKIIRSDSDYQAALKRIDELMDAKPGTFEAEALDLWTTLVSIYEDEKFPLAMPSVTDAIKFRMEQQGLSRKDLIAIIGSASKVSEVLSGKRSLSLAMIRKLHDQLRIPAEVLLQEPETKLMESDGFNWNLYPIQEMIRRAWIEFQGKWHGDPYEAQMLMMDFLKPFNQSIANPAYCRQHIRIQGQSDRYALNAWLIKALHLADEQHLPKYRSPIGADFIRQVVKFSFFEKGPLIAKEFLEKNGIHFVALDHLKKTYLDGVATITPDESPLIALTLRYDRLDNFWFTLIHELAHLALHLSKDKEAVFFDDLEISDSSQLEKEADELASECLIPRDSWEKSGLGEYAKADQIIQSASELCINPAIIAGRIRHDSGNFRILSNLVGHSRVRQLFWVKRKSQK